MSSSECRVFLPKSCAGSIRMPSRRTPSATARSASAVTVATTSATTSSNAARCGRVRGPQPAGVRADQPGAGRGGDLGQAGSAPAQVSLTRSAPAATASAATSARQVSIEMTTSGKRRRTAATVGTVRRISSAASTSAPGPALTPPMSMMSAPSATAASTARSAASARRRWRRGRRTSPACGSRSPSRRARRARTCAAPAAADRPMTALRCPFAAPVRVSAVRLLSASVPRSRPWLSICSSRRGADGRGASSSA